MARGTRGSAFNKEISGLERAKNENPFASGGRGFSLPSNYKETEAGAFQSSGAKVSDYYKPDKNATTKFEKGDGKGYLDNFIKGALSNKDKMSEKSDTDKLIDFAKSQQLAAQFGDASLGAFSEVADGFSYGQLPSQTQQMFIPGQQGEKGFSPLGALGGAITGFKAGGPLGAIGGGISGGFG